MPRGRGQRSIVLARRLSTGKPRVCMLSNRPFSKTLPRSILTRCMVWPWLLWIEIAHARMRGICMRRASTAPCESSTRNSSRTRRTASVLDPSSAGNSTKGYRSSSLDVELGFSVPLFLGASVFTFQLPPATTEMFSLSSLLDIPSSGVCPSSCNRTILIGAVPLFIEFPALPCTSFCLQNPSTLPTLPLTNRSSRFLISITWAPVLSLSSLGAIMLLRSFPRCSVGADPESRDVKTWRFAVRAERRVELACSTSSRIGKSSVGRMPAGSAGRGRESALNVAQPVGVMVPRRSWFSRSTNSVEES
ncbi:hypothetical protein B0H10DRAFT_382580 [Mycena sp. CBHHK59/15]|nr:hypothetical protein B0H10DRAFT_382580 [Mycena sp. CBHHK59/15]